MADLDPHLAHLIDLRPAAEQVASPLTGMPLTDAPLTGARVTALTLAQIEDGQHALTPPHGPLLVVCQRGTQADLAARYLRSDGLDAQAWRGTVAELQAKLGGK